MKIDNRYWLYSIECIPTGRIYIGQTGKPNPCWRWSDHFVELRRGISKCPRLQAEWNAYPHLKFWRFQTLDEVEGKRLGNGREAELILAIVSEKRLNILTTSCISLTRRSDIETMLRQGRKYADIKAAVGISMGMISRIAKQLNLARNNLPR